MEHREKLNKSMRCEQFLKFYYLKEELVLFCKEEGLQTTGNKNELNERIAHYLATSEKLTKVTKKRSHQSIQTITIDMLLEENFVCSQTHRVFFKQQIGNSFSFPVAFQKWLKENAGKTYQDAINAYYEILDELKKHKTTIDKQFEYNTYIRAFFEDNKSRTLKEAIQCWNYKKGLPGHNRYEEMDVSILNT